MSAPSDHMPAGQDTFATAGLEAEKQELEFQKIEWQYQHASAGKRFTEARNTIARLRPRVRVQRLAATAATEVGGGHVAFLLVLAAAAAFVAVCLMDVTAGLFFSPAEFPRWSRWLLGLACTLGAVLGWHLYAGEGRRPYPGRGIGAVCLVATIVGLLLMGLSRVLGLRGTRPPSGELDLPELMFGLGLLVALVAVDVGGGLAGALALHHWGTYRATRATVGLQTQLAEATTGADLARADLTRASLTLRDIDAQIAAVTATLTAHASTPGLESLAGLPVTERVAAGPNGAGHGAGQES